MKPRNNLGIMALDTYLLGSIYFGYHYALPGALGAAEFIMWFFTGAGIFIPMLLLTPAKSTATTLVKLRAADKLWSILDRQNKLERLYDEATDVAYVLLLWIAGAPVLAVAYGITVVFKAYNRTQGARMRVLKQAGEVSEP